jgi:hypothetical protein
VSGEQEPVGSLGAEAAKLLAALQDWAKDSGSEYVEAAAAAATGATAGVNDLGEHLATGSAECSYCPVCRAIAAARSTSPEVKAHLRLAATSLVEAVAGMLATATPTPGSRPERGPEGSQGEGPGRRGSPVERIDVTGDDGSDDGDDGADTEWEDGR